MEHNTREDSRYETLAISSVNINTSLDKIFEKLNFEWADLNDWFNRTTMQTLQDIGKTRQGNPNLDPCQGQALMAARLVQWLLKEGVWNAQRIILWNSYCTIQKLENERWWKRGCVARCPTCLLGRNAIRAFIRWNRKLTEDETIVQVCLKCIVEPPPKKNHYDHPHSWYRRWDW